MNTDAPPMAYHRGARPEHRRSGPGRRFHLVDAWVIRVYEEGEADTLDIRLASGEEFRGVPLLARAAHALLD